MHQNDDKYKMKSNHAVTVEQPNQFNATAKTKLFQELIFTRHQSMQNQNNKANEINNLKKND